MVSLLIFNRKYVHTVACTVVFVFNAYPGRNATCPLSGSQPVYRKLFPHGPHSSKNNFFEIKISQRRDWETPSLSYYGPCSKLISFVNILTIFCFSMPVQFNTCSNKKNSRFSFRIKRG